MAPQWLWDASRRLYYYTTQDSYVYQSGLRIPIPGYGTAEAQPIFQDSSAASNEGQDDEPKTTPYMPDENDLHELTQEVGEMSMSPSRGGYYSGESTDYAPHSGTTAPGSYYRENYSHIYAEQSADAELETARLGAQVLTVEPTIDTTDPDLYGRGIVAKGKISGTLSEGYTKKLFPQFKVQKPARKFFVPGKVFKVLWPEVIGQSNDGMSITTVFYGENVGTKLRWFIVIKAGTNFCTCLPINTYKRKGVSKPSVVVQHHAIAYSSRQEPPYQTVEYERVMSEGPMMPGIRVVPKRKSDKLDIMSRIDFARMYTIEHNVKVYEFGDVHRDSLERFQQQWFILLQTGLSGPLQNIPDAGEEEDGSEVERYGQIENYGHDNEDEDEEEAEEEEEEENEDEEEEEEEEEEQHRRRHHKSSSSKHYEGKRKRRQ